MSDPKPNPLPDVDRLIVAFDTETSGLYEDDGARVSVVSWAFRHPDSGKVETYAACFDQGQDPTVLFPEEESLIHSTLPGWVHLPLGPKDLDAKHIKRITKWRAEHGLAVYQAPNKSPDAWGRLLTWLSRQHLICHNAKFDLLKMAKGLRGREEASLVQGGGLDLSGNVIADTQSKQSIIDPRGGTALKPTSVRLSIGAELGLDAGTEDREQQALKPWKGPQNDPRFDLIPWRVIRLYAELDAGLTLLLNERQNELLQDPANWHQVVHVRNELELMRTLYNMERRGIGFDAEAARRQVEVIERLKAEAAAKLPFKPTYPGARGYFFGPEDKGGLGLIPFSDKMTKPSKTHPAGQPQVDEEVVARLVKSDVPNAATFERYAELDSARAKWYQAWADMTGPDGRLRTNHKQNDVVSGRLAVSRAQLQAIPHIYQIPKGLDPVRGMFHAKPGHTLIEIDVSQAEIRIATAVARCQPMLDQFLDGQDSHSAATWLMFRDEFEPAGFHTLREAESGHSKWKEWRGVAKRCNLGILYGAGVNTVQEQIKKFTGIEYPQRQVRGWVDDWRRAFPQFVKLLDVSAKKASRDGWVRLVNGRIRWFSDYEPTHKAANQVIQGSQAEVIKRIMVIVDQKYPGMLLLCIHDSLVLEIPDELVDVIAKDVQRIMVDEFEKAFARQWVRGGPLVVVPFAADMKVWDAHD